MAMVLGTTTVREVTSSSIAVILVLRIRCTVGHTSKYSRALSAFPCREILHCRIHEDFEGHVAMSGLDDKIDRALLEGTLDDDSPGHLVMNGLDPDAVLARLQYLVRIGLIELVRLSDDSRVNPSSMTKDTMLNDFDLILGRTETTLPFLIQNFWNSASDP
jgi:hypothetical protein